MSEWIAKHPDELRPGLYVPVQALRELEARVEALEGALREIDELCPHSSESQIAVRALAATEQGESDAPR